MHVITRTVLTIAATVSFGIAAPAIASADTPANDFATNYSGCLGPLRSAIASGALDGATLPAARCCPAASADRSTRATTSERWRRRSS